MSHQLPSIHKHKTVGGTPPYYTRVFTWAYDYESGMRVQVVKAVYGSYQSEVYANAVAEALDHALPDASSLQVEVLPSDKIVVPRAATPEEAAAEWEAGQ